MNFNIGQKIVCTQTRIVTLTKRKYKITENVVYIVQGRYTCSKCGKNYIDVGQKRESKYDVYCECDGGSALVTDSLYWSTKFFAPLDDWANALSSVNQMLREINEQETGDVSHSFTRRSKKIFYTLK
jgi:late competence protein required for DNA uptake (superfamily II DNA/RNA helicase)